MTTPNEFFWPIRVYYEDTDSGGVIYYANYLKFMERARTEWLRHLGLEQDELRDQDGVLFVVRRVTLDLRRPGRFNDELTVGVRIKQLGKASIIFEQNIKRVDDDCLLCNGEVKVACIDAERFRPCPLPKSVAAVMPRVL